MAILLFAFVVAWAFAAAFAAISSPSIDSKALVQRAPQPSVFKKSSSSGQRYGIPQEPTPDLSKDYELLDIVLVASVDGKFHALNRSSGHTLWSMSSFATTTSVSAPSSLAPLVRTSHALPIFDPDSIEDPDDEDALQQETYIIEPQSGAIYVLHTPSAPLQRFPFSMSELVDISPFTSVNNDDTRVFVGRKETSLLLIELETGKIKATLNSECPPIFNWDDEEDTSEVDLDDLEGSKPPISAPTEVYIGRTDYHISIHKKPLPGMPALPVQNLSFSTYGPNNRDNHLQAIYRRTNDDAYIQSLPNGEVISFKAKAAAATAGGENRPEGGQPVWGHQFGAPIVAIFDVLQPHPSSSHHLTNPHPFVLLQPRPRLQDLFPNLTPKGPVSAFPNLDSAYVGLVEETGSLFAMSPETYPLVVFGGSERDRMVGKDKKWRSLDPPRYGGYRDNRDKETHAGTDSGTETEEDIKCLRNPYDARCLTGVRQLEDEDGYEGRMKRLLDGPKTQTPGVQQPMGTNDRPVEAPVVIEVGRHGEDGWDGTAASDNASGTPLADRFGISDGVPSSHNSRSWLGRAGIGMPGSGVGVGAAWEAVLVMLLFGLVSVWFVWSKVKGKVQRKVQVAVAREEQKEARIHENGDAMAVVNVQDGEVIGAEEGGSALGVAMVKDGEKEVSSSLLPIGNGSLPVPPNKATPDTPSLDPPTPVLDIPTPNAAGLDEGDESEGEGDGGVPPAPGKRKVRRGRRGKKKKPGIIAASNSGGPEGEEKEKEPEKQEEKKSSSLILTSSSPKPPVVQQPSLTVSDTILGFGSHGTVVFQGSLQGRAVAVKRLLQDFVTLAAREVSILQESDDHPNVIRYYYQESHENFLYIALELCPASLADIIETPDREQWRDIAINFDPKKALKQIASGLRHLHALKLVHRDIKPQNILVSSAKATSANSFGAKNGKGGAYRMLISDFGLCKKLDMDQTSFLPTAHGALAAGTVGWRAPEILRGEVKLDEFTGEDGASTSSRGSVATVNGSSSSGGTSSRPQTRLTKSVDIFALGCLFYYTLTNGGHPYGDRFEREVNIMKDAKDLSGLERFGEEGTEATDLITAMLHPQASGRPDTTTCLLHPFFWDPGRRLNFLQDASDRFEIMCRDPKDPNLLTLEKGAVDVVGLDWHSRLDRIFIENLGKYRKYDGKSVQDLLRALRNKKHHYQDLPENVKRHLGPMPEGFLGYFTRRYPQLFLHVHKVIKDTGLHSESMFRMYFELPDT